MGVVNRLDCFQLRVLRSKYAYSDGILPKVRRRAKISNSWRGIVFVWPRFKRNLIWRMGDNQSIKIWTNHQLPGINNLGDFASIDLDRDSVLQVVVDYAANNGDWNWDKLAPMFPRVWTCLCLLKLFLLVQVRISQLGFHMFQAVFLLKQHIIVGLIIVQ